jgi:hypothetical protein
MRKVVTTHAEKSVGTHKSKGRKGPHWPHREPAQNVKVPQGDVLAGSPGSGEAPGASGNPTTGGISPGGPLGTT